MSEERWRFCNDKDVWGYEVSDKGRIRNPMTGRILKTQVNDKGYEVVSIRGATKRVHKLVADAYIDGEHDGLVVAHKDRNRRNNDASNLEFRTRSENVRRTYLEGRKQTHRMRAIRCIETGEEYPSIVECSKATGINKHNIRRCVNNPATKTRDGLHFEPID